MNEIIEELSKIDIMIEDAIVKCQTNSYKAKETAKDMRNNGFDGEMCGKLIKECELALRYANMYQAYVNTLVCE